LHSPTELFLHDVVTLIGQAAARIENCPSALGQAQAPDGKTSEPRNKSFCTHATDIRDAASAPSLSNGRLLPERRCRNRFEVRRLAASRLAQFFLHAQIEPLYVDYEPLVRASPIFSRSSSA